MSWAPRILVVAATPRELAPAGEWTSLQCGVGPVEAAVATAREIARQRPEAILHVGIAGARRQASLVPGTLVVGSHSVYHDLGDLPAEWAVRQITSDPRLVEAIRSRFPAAACRAIGTSARVGGTLAAPLCDVEAMEGFAVLRAAQTAGVPAIEVRAISNEIEQPDRSRWHFDLAFETITTATPLLVEAIRRALRVEHDA